MKPLELLSEVDQRVGLTALKAFLTLIAARVRHLRRAVRGTVNPGEIVTRRNGVFEHSKDDDPDLVLFAWDARARAAHAQQELGAAQKELEPVRRRQHKSGKTRRQKTES